MMKGTPERDRVDGKRKVEVREYYLKQDRDRLDIEGGPDVDTVEFGEGVSKKPSKGMIWLFEKDKGRFFQSTEPVLPAPSDASEAFGGAHNLTGDMVKEVLSVCQETYEGSDDKPPQMAERWQRDNSGERFLWGGTRCVMRPKGDTLYVGFRGSANEMDWEDNSCFSLVGFAGDNDAEKVHEGFKRRAADIMANLLANLPSELPNKIVFTGHSLGAAISQVVYMKFQQAVMEHRNLTALNCEVLNVTFATPLVGNINLRNTLMPERKNLAKNMFHFVLKEDIVPSVLFYKHAYERIPRPTRAAEILGITKKMILLKILRAAWGDAIPEEATTIEIPVYEQPVYDEQDTVEPYAPVGNYFYIKKSCDGVRLYKLSSNEDPQYVAQALIPVLNVLRRMGSLDFFLGKSLMRKGTSKVPLVSRAVDKVHPLVTEIIKGHSLTTYKDKIDRLWNVAV